MFRHPGQDAAPHGACKFSGTRCGTSIHTYLQVQQRGIGSPSARQGACGDHCPTHGVCAYRRTTTQRAVASDRLIITYPFRFGTRFRKWDESIVTPNRPVIPADSRMRLPQGRRSDAEDSTKVAQERTHAVPSGVPSDTQSSAPYPQLEPLPRQPNRPARHARQS